MDATSKTMDPTLNRPPGTKTKMIRIDTEVYERFARYCLDRRMKMGPYLSTLLKATLDKRSKAA